jgi:integrase/recombinase XerD
MKTLKKGIQDYLVLRRSLGFKLKKHSRFLEEFALFLEQAGELRITVRFALQWATQPQQLQQAEWAARLSVVRGFARYWSAIDPMTEIPPEGLLPFRHSRAKPYLYSDKEIHQLSRGRQGHACDTRPTALDVSLLVRTSGRDRATYQ